MAQTKIAVPIDRPLSKAYLRQFTGWSTAYPPGVSDPTSLRVMHNCNVDTDGSLRIRPGLKSVFAAPTAPLVGSFEHFYVTYSGATRKALLFAVREANNTVTFRVAAWMGTSFQVLALTTIFPGATGISFSSSCTYVKYVQINNKIIAMAETSNAADTFLLFDVGASPTARKLSAINAPAWSAAHAPSVLQPSDTWIAGSQVTVPTTGTNAQSLTTGTRDYNMAYFYTFSNEIGESAPSQVRSLAVNTRWTAWAADVGDESKSLQQLAMVIPDAAWNIAYAAGATHWTLYMFTWSNQDNVPVVGVQLKTTPILYGGGRTAATEKQLHGWATHTPLSQGQDGYLPVPSANTRYNFTEPLTAGNGIVAADRMVAVYNRLKAAEIRWTSNQQGEYLDFSSSKGGGIKTLTSGNMFFPACVKLWQNPQSVDTLTVLCMGLDGEGTSYYMNANSSVNTQSQATTVMGFEETTATPGTVSPYGCEVLNNALYHPLDNNLMKSTASNYNINHSLMADAIANMWRAVPLSDKNKIVSSQMDSSLYYLVKSPVAWNPESTARGNQVWVLDTAQSNIWSCWDIEGNSLRKLEINGQLYMSVSIGGSLYILDPEKDNDDYWDATDSTWKTQGIPWEIVTNTQGANRAHDAWSLLQQVNVVFGNFTGECIYGIRGKDVNGKFVEIQKHYRSDEIIVSHDPLFRYDQQDFLLIRRIMMEWEFFWKSAPRPKNRSYGSIGYVQYRYAPATVNVGYEYGSVETFEYGNRTNLYPNGVPAPNADTLKP